MILHIFVKNNAMNKKLASQQYASNQMGSTPGPGLGKRIKNLFKGDKPKNQRCDIQGSCSKTAAYNAGGGKSNTGTKSYTVKTSSGTGGEKNVVLKKGSRAEKRWQKKIGEVKSNAPARPMTRKEKEKANEMRPSRQDYNDNNVPKSVQGMSKKSLLRRK
jgi:hypothetical protein